MSKEIAMRLLKKHIPNFDGSEGSFPVHHAKNFCSNFDDKLLDAVEEALLIGFESDEEQNTFKAIIAARDVQDFLWGDKSLEFGNFFQDKNVGIEIFQKRVDKIASISPHNHSWKVELRKRVLQQAALSIMLMKLIK